MWRSTTQASRKIKCACSVVGRHPKVPARCQLCTKADAPPPQPPPAAPPKRLGRRFLKFLAGSVVVAGGTMAGAVAYAKANPEFRRQVESNWPILLDITPYLFNDNADKTTVPELPAFKKGSPTQGQMPPALFQEAKEAEEKAALPAPEETVETPGADQLAIEQAKEAEKAKEEEEEEAAREERAKEESRLERLQRQHEEEQRAKELHDKMVEQEIEDAADLAALEAVFDKITVSSAQLTRDAVVAQKKAALLTEEHRDRLKEAMEEPQSDIEEKRAQWNRVVEAADAKLQALKVARDYAQVAREELEKLQVVIAESKEKTPRLSTSQTMVDATRNLNSMNYDLDTATAEVLNAQSESNILKDYHDLIQEGKEQFSKELKSLMPEVQLGEKGKKLTEAELNSLIAHGHRRVEQLQHQLAEQQAMEQRRLQQALDRQRKELEEASVEAVNRELERKEGQFAIDLQKKIEQVMGNNEKELHVQLRRQAAAHSEHLSDVLRQQVQEFDQQQQQREQVVRTEERDAYQQQLVGALATLNGVQAAVEGRAGMEKQVQKAQELWLACENLKRIIATGESRTAVANEVVAISDAAGDNAFVEAIVRAIPERALLEGVPSRASLRERWEDVQRVCRRVAMVEEAGDGLATYLLSFLQSLFVLRQRRPTAAEPDQPLEAEGLDAFRLLDAASLHVEQGDLELAVRFLTQLRGMPRRVVADWLAEARLLLETSQAASALSTHASASGLGGLNF